MNPDLRLDPPGAPRPPLFLEVRDLRLVDAVARCGSLTSAGRELHVTESALSHQLASLERRIGTKVFARLARRMVITPAGERLRQTARSVLGELRRAEEDLADAQRRHESVVRIGAECDSAYRWLHPAVARLCTEFPDVHPRMLAASASHAVERLIDGRLEIAIVASPVDHPRVVVSPLFTDEIVAIVAPGHPWAVRPYVSAADVRGEHLVGCVRATDGEEHLRELLHVAVANPKDALAAHLSEVVLELVKAGVGAALLDRSAVSAHVADGSVVAVRLTRMGVYRRWSVVTLGAPARYAQAFVRLLAKPAA